MKRSLGIGIAAAALVLASASTAGAQDNGGGGTTAYVPVAPGVLAPSSAFEITMGLGYTEGFGKVGSPSNRVLPGVGNDLRNFGGAGISFNLGIDHRMSPGVSIGWDASEQEFNASTDLPVAGSSVRGITTGPHITGHMMPYDRLDPWISLGTGYRAMWIALPDPNQNQVTHGFELARLTLGMDARVTKDVALGPVIGADINMFVWQSPTGNIFHGDNQGIDGKRVNTFLFAGLQGRFDLGGAREARPVVTMP